MSQLAEHTAALLQLTAAVEGLTAALQPAVAVQLPLPRPQPTQREVQRARLLHAFFSGSGYKEIAASLATSAPNIRSQIHGELRRRNREAYEAGYSPDSYTNYGSPSVDYLRQHRQAFGVDLLPTAAGDKEAP